MTPYVAAPITTEARDDLSSVAPMPCALRLPTRRRKSQIIARVCPASCASLARIKPTIPSGR
jgi:hypothetical protein